MKNFKYSIACLFLLSISFFLVSFQQSASRNQQVPELFGFGKTPTTEQIAALDIDVRPDGKGLPDGEGTAEEGSVIYKAQCASCHGATGREGPQDVLVGDSFDEDFKFAESVEYSRTKNIRNYWPYASTIFDYTYRAMPQNAPGTLSADEVYSLVAFLLVENEIISDESVMNKTTLPEVVMPAEKYFIGGVK